MNLSKTKPDPLEIIIESRTADHPSPRYSRTYGFFQTTTMNTGIVMRSMIRITVDSGLVKTLRSSLAEDPSTTRVMRSPNDAASGVATLSGLPRTLRTRMHNVAMNVLSSMLDTLPVIMALTIMRALSNQLSLCGLTQYPSTNDRTPASRPIVSDCT